MSTPPNAMTARRPLCLVRDSSPWEECSTNYFISVDVFFYA